MLPSMLLWEKSQFSMMVIAVHQHCSKLLKLSYYNFVLLLYLGHSRPMHRRTQWRRQGGQLPPYDFILFYFFCLSAQRSVIAMIKPLPHYEICVENIWKSSGFARILHVFLPENGYLNNTGGGGGGVLAV